MAKKKVWLVEYTGVNSNINGYKVPGGENKNYSFARGRPVEFAPGKDLDWFKFKASKNPDDWKIHSSLPDGFEDKDYDHLPGPGPENMDEQAKKFAEVREYFRQLRGNTLTPELKKLKGIIEGGN